jgi:hypothetical protein
VREDYSADGNAWNHFPHDMASWRGLVTAISPLAAIEPG